MIDNNLFEYLLILYRLEIMSVYQMLVPCYFDILFSSRERVAANKSESRSRMFSQQCDDCHTASAAFTTEVKTLGSYGMKTRPHV